jgi:diguanylate cyclase (GGDEF)-like protein
MRTERTGRAVAVRRTRGRSMQVATSACVAIALLGLTGSATWSAYATSAAASASQVSGALADAYTAARFAVGEEESLELAYRLEPTPAGRPAHEAAATDVNSAMDLVARIGEAHDRADAARVVRGNAKYLAASLEVLDAVDRHDDVAVRALDQGAADTTFAALQADVDVQADRHERVAAAAERRLADIELQARWFSSLAVAVAVLLIGLFWRLRRYYARETDAAGRLNIHQATHDGLTGLPNRLEFAALLEGHLSSAAACDGSVGVMLLDLNRFKEINDTFGHHYGDLLLQQVGPRIRGALDDDELLARLGGDEFALLVPSVRRGEQALDSHRSIVRRVLAALGEPFEIEGISLAIEASVGIAMFPEHGTTGQVLLQRADIAMYLAKANHEDITVYDRTLDDHNPRKLHLLSQLRTAVDRAELVLHYQPLVDIASNRVRGAEALVRWQHPEEGLLPPSEFLPLAEGSGFIHELTRYVLQTACRQAKLWRDAGHPLVISVNVSARCLLDSVLPDRVAAILAEAGLPAYLLKLEITESAIMTDPVRAQEVINRLHGLGLALSIDDFGTGYTSLSYLRDLPVQELKIDRSFVSRMLYEHKDAVIVRTGTELARRLGLESVAEGIEDAETLTALSALGCTTAQGYHLGRPMASEHFDVWLDEWNGDHPVLPAQREALSLTALRR